MKGFLRALRKKLKKVLDKKGELCYNSQVPRMAAHCECSSMVEFQPSKLAAWVRFPSLAPKDSASQSGGRALSLLEDVPLAQ